jgi:hypothetical protein
VDDIGSSSSTNNKDNKTHIKLARIPSGKTKIFGRYT